MNIHYAFEIQKWHIYIYLHIISIGLYNILSNIIFMIFKNFFSSICLCLYPLKFNQNFLSPIQKTKHKHKKSSGSRKDEKINSSLPLHSLQFCVFNNSSPFPSSSTPIQAKLCTQHIIKGKGKRQQHSDELHFGGSVSAICTQMSHKALSGLFLS